MRYSFRLAELLGHIPDPRKRPGTIKTIVEYTGLDRHQVAALLNNEVKYIPLKALSRLCDYLIEHGHVPADQLPGALFAIEPENFWEMLARRKRLELCVGVRREEEGRNAENAWIVASDSVLLGELLNGVSTLGGTARHQQAVQPSGGIHPHPEHLKQTLVWSPFQSTDETVQDRAEEVYREFSHTTSDKALVCLGSVKSNPVTELIFAETFHCDPFTSQDTIGAKADRSCPIYLRYRDDDPHPASCCAGITLGQDGDDRQPGIYYQNPDGSWSLCPWTPEKDDAAFVFYIHREAQGRLEMVLGGFSGRATRLLAKYLSGRAESLWPPVFEGQGVQIGAFVIQFSVTPGSRKASDLIRIDPLAQTRVIPLSPEVIEQKLLHPRGPRRRTEPQQPDVVPLEVEA